MLYDVARLILSLIDCWQNFACLSYATLRKKKNEKVKTKNEKRKTKNEKRKMKNEKLKIKNEKLKIRMKMKNEKR